MVEVLALFASVVSSIPIMLNFFLPILPLH